MGYIPPFPPPEPGETKERYNERCIEYAQENIKHYNILSKTILIVFAIFILFLLIIAIWKS